MYVLKRVDDGTYVTPPGQRASYTRFFQHARVFDSATAAQREACDNEIVVTVSQEMERKR